MRDTLHNSRFTRTKYNLRIITYEIIKELCKTNPILSAVGGLKMNLKLCKKMTYENKTDWTLGENKPNQTQNKPNLTQLKPISMPIKPNSNPKKACPERSRMGQFRNHTTTSKERKEKRISGTFSGSQLPERI